MKVISILQPWATLVVMGAKKIETRSWNTKHRGPLLIHASKRWDNQLYQTIIDIGAEDVLEKAEYKLTKIVNGKIITNLPLGAIIGRVNLVDTLPSEYLLNKQFSLSIKGNQFMNKGISDQELAFGDYCPGRYGWLLSDPVQFAQPIPAKGSLSIWNYKFEGDHAHILQCTKCGYTACADMFPINKNNIDTDEEDWNQWCPKCEEEEIELIIDGIKDFI